MNTHTLDNKQKKRCIFVKENGSQCGSYAMKESEFCYFHNPGVEAERIETKRNGGKQKILVVNDSIPCKLIKLENPKQVTKFYSKLINEVMSGQMDLRIATGISYKLNGILKAKELSEFEQRLEDIENKILENQNN